jgi:hypothetical protein
MNGIDLELRPEELLASYRRCGLTADWLASYVSSDLDSEHRAAVKNVLSTVINELLENAVKFSVDPTGSIRITARREANAVRIETWNRASEDRARLLESTLEELGRSSPDALFAQRMAQSSAPGAPGVGIIIIRRDHGARVGVELTPRGDGSFEAHVSVALDLLDER